MASCYICGASGASLRRRVYVGDSHRVYFGGKGLRGASSGLHFGIRTLCVSCASQHDKNERASLIKWAALILIVIFYVFTGNVNDKKILNQSYLKTITTKQSNIRSGPSTETSIIITVPENHELIILKEDNGWLNIETEYLGNRVNGWISRGLTQ